MKLWSILLASVFSLAVLASCGGNDDINSGADSGVMAEPAAFGEACGADEGCESNTCRNFNMLGMVCTVLCTENSMCPNGSMGQKCNMNGFCRP